MSSKSAQQLVKSGPEKPAIKIRKGATETSRLFIDVEEVSRKAQTPLTRYVE